MPQPISEIDVVNLALDRLGHHPGSSISNPQDAVEFVMSRWYQQTRREMLRKYIFNFARKSVLLTASANAPTHPEFSNGYALPNDFVRLLTIGDRVLYGGAIPTNFFDFNQGFLYCDDLTDQGAAAVPAAALQVNYIYDVKLVQAFDPLFLKVLVLQLAVNVCKKVTGKEPSERLLSELLDADVAAAAVAGQEKPPRRVQRSRIRDVRRSGGIFRNNTVIGGWGP